MTLPKKISLEYRRTSILNMCCKVLNILHRQLFLNAEKILGDNQIGYKERTING
jgi:hypothetical protein